MSERRKFVSASANVSIANVKRANASGTRSKKLDDLFAQRSPTEKRGANE
jgi:hypothetical protein